MVIKRFAESRIQNAGDQQPEHNSQRYESFAETPAFFAKTVLKVFVYFRQGSSVVVVTITVMY